jgi:hypothetical protein
LEKTINVMKRLQRRHKMADKILHFEVTESHTSKIDVGFRFDVTHNTSRSLDASISKALAEELGIIVIPYHNLLIFV